MNTWVTYDIRLMGSFQTTVIQGRSGSETVPDSTSSATSSAVSGGAVVVMPSMVAPGAWGRDRVFATFLGVATAQAARRMIGVPGVVLVLLGAVCALLAFRLLHWYDVPAGHDSSGDVTFSKLHASADQLGR